MVDKKKESEASLMRRIALKASEHGARLWRNNTAKGWAGKSVVITESGQARVMPGDVLVHSARRLHAGLCVGSSDLIGLTPVLITEQHIGKTLAVFTAAEVKAGTNLTGAQQSFLEMVTRSGGIAIAPTSVEQFEAELMRHARTPD